MYCLVCKHYSKSLPSLFYPVNLLRALNAGGIHEIVASLWFTESVRVQNILLHSNIGQGTRKRLTTGHTGVINESIKNMEIEVAEFSCYARENYVSS